MPTRILRDLTTSERYNRASYFDQSLYTRLLNKVDDYGRHEANPVLLASLCFPYGDADIGFLPMQSGKVEGGLRSLASKGLIYVYKAAGKTYLVMHKWKERIRTESRCPCPKSGTPLFGDLAGLETEPENITQPDTEGETIEQAHINKVLTQHIRQMSDNCQTNDSQVSDKCLLPTPCTHRPVPIAYSPECEQVHDRPLGDLRESLCRLFGRDPEDRWSYEEERLLVEVAGRKNVLAEFLAISEHRFKTPESDRRFLKGRDVLGLLRDWNQALDQAKLSKGFKPPKDDGLTQHERDLVAGLAGKMRVTDTL